jgi:copper(I)-binding protein
VPARRTAVVLAAVLLPLALAGCGVGQDPQTYRERTTQDASNIAVGDLALRDVAIQPPDNGAAEAAAGSNGLVTLTIVSTSGQADTLTSVSSPAASSTDIVDGTGHPVQSLTVPSNGSVGSGDFGVVLRGLTGALRPGTYVPMTFTFANAGSVTFKVPMKIYDSPVPRASYSPQAAGE